MERVRKPTLLLGLIIVGMAGYAGADSTIEVGTHGIMPAADQRIELRVSGDDDVTGINLFLQLNDGLDPDPEPIFTAVDLTGSIWDAFDQTATGGPIDTVEQIIQASVVFNRTGDDIQAGDHALLATLVIDASDFNPGDSFPLSLTVPIAGESTHFIGFGGSRLDATLIDGRINIIPEPTTALLFTGAAGLLFLRRRA